MRPLANLVAVYDPANVGQPLDPNSGAGAAGRRGVAPGSVGHGSHGESAAFRPAPGWRVVVHPLPESPVVRRRANGATLFVFEGAELLESGAPSFADWALAPGRGHERNGADGLADYPGDFGFLRIGDDGAAFAVRSCGGLVPLFWHAEGERMIVSTTLTGVRDALTTRPALDPLACAVWSTAFPLAPDRRTVIAGAQELARGSYCRWQPGAAVVTHSYWDPLHGLGQWERSTAADRAEGLRELLLAGLERDLDPAGANLLTLSGGVDSSSLAALIRGQLGFELSTWSFLPLEEQAYAEHVRFIHILEQRYGFRRRKEFRASAGSREELLQHAPRVAYPVPHPALCDLPGVCEQQPVRVLVGGEWADELCGSRFTLPDWARETPFMQLVRRPANLPMGMRGYSYWVRRRVHAVAGVQLPFPDALPDFVRASVREEYGDWLAARRKEALGWSGPWWYRRQRAEMDAWVAMNWEAASVLGVRRSIPFHTREVLELGEACHPTELIGPGWKVMLRRALDGLVPRENLHRQQDPHWRDGRHELRPGPTPRLAEALEAVVDPAWLAATQELSYSASFALSILVACNERLTGSKAKPLRTNATTPEMSTTVRWPHEGGA